MNETAFETIAQAAVALKLDFSSEEFAGFAEDHGLSEDEIEVVRSVFAYLKEKKQQTTVMTLLKMSRLPTKEPKTFENFDFSLLKGKDVERLKALPSLSAIYSHRNLAFIGPAAVGYNYCNKLFALEKKWKTQTNAERLKSRQYKSEKIVDEYYLWVRSLDPVIGSKLEDAVNYALNQEQYLRAFLKNGEVEISNNFAENAIRPFVIGRKNWLFSDTVKGAKSSAIIYSLIEMCIPLRKPQLHGV